jgi:hypothetical protein
MQKKTKKSQEKILEIKKKSRIKRKKNQKRKKNKNRNKVIMNKGQKVQLRLS